MQPTDHNTDNKSGAATVDVKAWPFVIVVICLMVVLVGWGVNFLLVANDDVLEIFIEVFLFFEWLLRFP